MSAGTRQATALSSWISDQPKIIRHRSRGKLDDKRQEEDRNRVYLLKYNAM
jgi:hypothetical protein